MRADLSRVLIVNYREKDMNSRVRRAVQRAVACARGVKNASLQNRLAEDARKEAQGGFCAVRPNGAR